MKTQFTHYWEEANGHMRHETWEGYQAIPIRYRQAFDEMIEANDDARDYGYYGYEITVPKS